MVPQFLTAYILAGIAFMMLSLVLIVRFAPVEAGINAAEPRRFGGAVLAITSWLTAALGLALAGAYVGATDRVPTIPYGIVLPIVFGIVAYVSLPAFRRLIAGIPQPWLVALQTYRALGVIFLILWQMGKAPALFAWPAGIGDVVIGLSAPLVALVYARTGAHAPVLWWNVFGLLDLIVAVATGFLTSPSPLQLYAFDAPNDLISRYPLVLIPTFLVPLSILLHLASLARLRQPMASPHTRA